MKETHSSGRDASTSHSGISPLSSRNRPYATMGNCTGTCEIWKSQERNEYLPLPLKSTIDRRFYDISFITVTAGSAFSQSASPTCRNGSRTLRSVSLLLLSTDMEVSITRRKTPSKPHKPMPSTMEGVKRNGTISGLASVNPCFNGYRGIRTEYATSHW